MGVATTGKHLSIVDEGLDLEGSVRFSGELLVRGRVSGKLTGDRVTIAEGGQVQADVKVGALTVAGRFDGEIRAMEELVILPGGCCSGKVFCRRLVLRQGGVLNAEVTFLAPDDRGIEKRLASSPPVIDL